MVHRIVRGREVDEYITSYLSDSKPSSMNCVRFSTYLQHDRPSLNPLFSRQVFPDSGLDVSQYDCRNLTSNFPFSCSFPLTCIKVSEREKLKTLILKSHED